MDRHGLRLANNDDRFREKAIVFDRSSHRFALVQRALQSRGFEVTRMEASIDSFGKLMARDTDLMIVSTERPVSAATELCRSLKERSDTRHIPILVIADTHTDAIAALAAGADDYLVIPIDPIDLAARAHAAVLRSRDVRGHSLLTGLPGAAPIQLELQRRLPVAEFSLLHADLDRFKEFNRRYGASHGDEAIRFLAAVLKSAAHRFDSGAFIAHLLGDHFAVLANIDAGESIARAIISDFEIRSPRLYENEDLTRGGMVLTDRRGANRAVRLMSVSVGVTTSRNARVMSESTARDIAEELRLRAKQIPGSAYASDHRYI